VFLVKTKSRSEKRLFLFQKKLKSSGFNPDLLVASAKEMSGSIISADE
jgi:hypothetical protein